MGTFFTQHILERMLQRSITEAMIVTVWKQGVHTKSPDGKIIISGLYEGRKLKIIAQQKKQHYILVTAYFYD